MAHKRKEQSGEAGGVPSFSERPRGVDGCKPDSVQRAACAERLDGHLSHVLASRRGRGPCGLRLIPGGCRRSRSVLGRRPNPSCSVLHRMGFFVPPRLRSGRWAFTPPFHPCRPVCTGVGGMFSVTLSVDRDFGPGPPRILRGMLPCGVRTFLSKPALRPAGSDRPPSQYILRGRRGGASGDLVDFNFVRGAIGDTNGQMQNTEHLADRAARAEKIIAVPENFKVCEGCDSIVTMRVASCPNCHGYRFDESPERVVEQARMLASRPQQSVTAEDLSQ